MDKAVRPAVGRQWGGQAAAGHAQLWRCLVGRCPSPGSQGGCCWGLRGAPSSSRSPCREFRHKINITFNNNDTVSFREHRSFQFQPAKSQGSESDYIVLPNILVLVRLLAGALFPGACGRWLEGH